MAGSQPVEKTWETAVSADESLSANRAGSVFMPRRSKVRACKKIHHRNCSPFMVVDLVGTASTSAIVKVQSGWCLRIRNCTVEFSTAFKACGSFVHYFLKEFHFVCSGLKVAPGIPPVETLLAPT